MIFGCQNHRFGSHNPIFGSQNPMFGSHNPIFGSRNPDQEEDEKSGRGQAGQQPPSERLGLGGSPPGLECFLTGDGDGEDEDDRDGGDGHGDDELRYLVPCASIVQPAVEEKAVGPWL